MYDSATLQGVSIGVADDCAEDGAGVACANSKQDEKVLIARPTLGGGKDGIGGPCYVCLEQQEW
jgi:hypothetical protein